MAFLAYPNVRVLQLFKAGKYAEGQALLNHLMNLAHPGAMEGSAPEGSGTINPIQGGSGIARSRPQWLIQEDPTLSSSDLSNLTFAKRLRQRDPLTATAIHPTLRSRGAAVSQHPTRSSSRLHPIFDQQPQVGQLSANTVTHQTPLANVLREPPAGVAETNIKLELWEEAQVKVLMTSKKGRLVLKKGDVVENGLYLVADPTNEMEKGLTPLSPVLTHWLRTFKSYIPLTVFNRVFLIDNQQEWSRRKAPSEPKIKDGASSLRVYGGAPPPEELTMQFEHWIDDIGLFIKYVTLEVWETLAKSFKGHREVVMELWESYGWMIALCYCCRLRQGMMHETVDNRIKHCSTLQSAIFDEARLMADSLNKRAYRTNPYAPDGPLAHLNPLTGLPRVTNSSASSRKPVTEVKAYSKTKLRGVTSTRKDTDWIPFSEWELMSQEQKREAKQGMIKEKCMIKAVVQVGQETTVSIEDRSMRGEKTVGLTSVVAGLEEGAQEEAGKRSQVVEVDISDLT
ncbi:uncharacterized protein MELLADRAFT_94116 [Melampsora larici-populina 98AG31]|uniref:Uncharacterized protein n=1 Tax=Melampsora larici-populina (strain 98AG31 / pathotype 3-4-7) TaxID=747676 RepID=F4S6I8_MELLP|nr:uncharacterized protein MELLADRAFT_94116 [Melampsora larici-populina 98AG31]EGF99695.1 hypothetical protein MELLADRAFT_94116 [Melampsora larici-populina 98AG31]